MRNSKTHNLGPQSTISLVLVLLFVMVLTCTPAAAQSDWRVFGGFSYMRSETSPYLEPFGLDHINSIGWGASVTQYMGRARWFGATAELSGSYKNPSLAIPANYFGEGLPESKMEVGDVMRTSTYSLMLGPTFAYRKNTAIEPFARILFGGVNQRAGLTSKGAILAGADINGSEWAFGFALGGGADIRISNLIALRGQADWIRSTFRDGVADRQNNIRLMGGLVFRISE